MKDIEIPRMLGVRLEPKLRYLTEIAARAKQCTLTEYVGWALRKSFKDVTLRLPPDPEPTYGPNGVGIPPPPDPEDERIKNEAMSVANMADAIWDENPFMRLLYVANDPLRHLMTEEDRRIWEYVLSRDEFKKPATNKFNRALIWGEWKRIKRKCLQRSVPPEILAGSGK